MVALFAVLASTVAREPIDTKFLSRAVAVTMIGWACGQIGSLAIRLGVAAALWPDPWGFVRGTLTYVMYRLEGDVPGLTKTAAGAIKANVGVGAGSLFRLFVNVAFVLVVLALVAKGYRFGKLRHSLWFLVPALLPFLWFAILRNHSEAHAFLIYRTVVFSLLCTWAVVLYG